MSMKLLYISIILLFLSIPVFAQTDDLTVCTQMLDKSLNEVETCRDTSVKLEASNALLKEQNRLLIEMISNLQIALAGKDKALEKKDDKIEELRSIKCNETTIKFKPLGWTIASRTKKVCY